MEEPRRSEAELLHGAALDIGRWRKRTPSEHTIEPLPGLMCRVQSRKGFCRSKLPPLSSDADGRSFRQSILCLTPGLLARAAGVDEQLRTFVVDALQRTASLAIPRVGFDLVSQSHRLVRYVLLETIG